MVRPGGEETKGSGKKEEGSKEIEREEINGTWDIDVMMDAMRDGMKNVDVLDDGHGCHI